MAIPGQLQGGDDSACEIVIGQQDYSYRFANNAMWLDTQGRAGAGDFLSVLTLDNQDMGLTGVTIEPASYNHATGDAKLVEELNRDRKYVIAYIKACKLITTTIQAL